MVWFSLCSGHFFEEPGWRYFEPGAHEAHFRLLAQIHSAACALAAALIALCYHLSHHSRSPRASLRVDISGLDSM